MGSREPEDRKGYRQAGREGREGGSREDRERAGGEEGCSRREAGKGSSDRWTPVD